MKRHLRLCLWLAVTVLCLGGCEIRVNWFGSHAYVPWYVVVVPALLIPVIAHICFVRQTYRCPKCGHTFRPRWYELSSWIHEDDTRVVRCPQCGRKGFCPRER